MFKNKRRKLQTGQSFVELSLSLVVLLLMLSGLLDLGRVYFIFVALEDGAGEAALFLSINPKCACPPRSASDPDLDKRARECIERIDPAYVPDAVCADPNNADYRARHAGGDDVDWSKANITVKTMNPSVGDPVSVSIEYSFQLLTPIIPKITGINPLKLKAEASQIILTETK